MSSHSLLNLICYITLPGQLVQGPRGNTETEKRIRKLRVEKRFPGISFSVFFKEHTLYFSKHIDFLESDHFWWGNNYFEQP